LCACYFAKHGFKVHLFELRSGISFVLLDSTSILFESLDIRIEETGEGRSINMALSRRGRDSLAYINCEEMITKTGVPLYARMIHDEKAHTSTSSYGPHGMDSNHVRYCPTYISYLLLT
jgi:kynurenine 3-monooxygenase